MTRLLASTSSALALCLAGLALAPSPARADDCLFDTNNDGTATAGVDTDLAADSGGVNDQLACGREAKATGADSVAVGGDGNDVGTDGAVASGSLSYGTGQRLHWPATPAPQPWGRAPAPSPISQPRWGETAMTPG